MLTTGIGAGNLYATGVMYQLYLCFYFVYILSTGTTGPCRSYGNIGRIYIDLYAIVHQRIYINGTNEVCRLALLSNGEIRTSLCTPFSPLSQPNANSPSISKVTVLIPATSPSW